MKQAVVLALPGTSSEEATGTLRHMDELFGCRFAGVRRIWIYTSAGVRRKLEQSGKPVMGPAEALAGLRDDGVTHVAVKSLHLAAGMEYTELRNLVQDVRDGQGGFKRIVLSIPLLDASADFERTIRCLLTSPFFAKKPCGSQPSQPEALLRRSRLPQEEMASLASQGFAQASPESPPRRAKMPRGLPRGASLPAGVDEGDALLLVAHGSRRPEAQVAYEKAAAFCRRLDSRVLLGTMMSHPGLEDVLRECKAAGIKKLLLTPLMIVAGFSAKNELAGGDPASWVSVLAREGIRCVPLIKGLGDHDDIVRIWLDDIERMLAELSGSNL